jgi:hypothetical protein
MNNLAVSINTQWVQCLWQFFKNNFNFKNTKTSDNDIDNHIIGRFHHSNDDFRQL